MNKTTRLRRWWPYQEVRSSKLTSSSRVIAGQSSGNSKPAAFDKIQASTEDLEGRMWREPSSRRGAASTSSCTERCAWNSFFFTSLYWAAESNCRKLFYHNREWVSRWGCTAAQHYKQKKDSQQNFLAKVPNRKSARIVRHAWPFTRSTDRNAKQAQPISRSPARYTVHPKWIWIIWNPSEPTCPNHPCDARTYSRSDSTSWNGGTTPLQHYLWGHLRLWWNGTYMYDWNIWIQSQLCPSTSSAFTKSIRNLRSIVACQEMAIKNCHLLTKIPRSF